MPKPARANVFHHSRAKALRFSRLTVAEEIGTSKISFRHSPRFAGVARPMPGATTGQKNGSVRSRRG